MRNGLLVVIIVAILVIAAASGIYYYYSTTSAKSSLVNVDFGLAPSPTEEDIAAYIALHGGFWKQQGLNVTLVSFSSDPGQMSAVAAGQINMGIEDIDSTIQAATNGVKFHLVAVSLAPADFVLMVAANSSYTSPCQLKGGTISASAAGSLSYLMDYVYAKYCNFTIGNSPSSDLHQALLGGPTAQLASLTTNKTQGWLWDYGTADIAASKGAVRVILNMSSIITPGNWLTNPIYASDSLIANHPDVIRKVLQGYFNAITYAKSNKTFSTQMVEQYFNVNSQVATEVVDTGLFGQVSFSNDGSFTPQDISAMTYVRSLIMQVGILQNPVNVSALYTTQFTPVQVQNVTPTSVGLPILMASDPATISRYE